MNTITLPEIVDNWKKENFKAIAKQALLNIKQKDLPLNKATENGGFVVENKLNFSIQSSSKNKQQIILKCFVFFYELVIGCGCGDAPFETPITCEMLCKINTQTSVATFSIINT